MTGRMVFASVPERACDLLAAQPGFVADVGEQRVAVQAARRVHARRRVDLRDGQPLSCRQAESVERASSRDLRSAASFVLRGGGVDEAESPSTRTSGPGPS
jgi:hypothetical protein